MRTEDHPLEYLDFEGVIPAGQYGAGAMLVWDTGVWQCASSDPTGDLQRGELKFALDGHKLQGRWMLLWTGRRFADKRKQNQWLLFKERDASARPADEYDVLDDLPLSVLSGRDLAQVAQGMAPERARKPSRKKPKTPVTPRQPKTATARPASRRDANRNAGDATDATHQRMDVRDARGSKRADFPRTFRPCLPTTTSDPPSDERWAHEIKYDGYRMLCAVQPQKIRFLSRNGNDWTDKVSSLASAVRRLPTRSAILDGEVAVIGESGATDFQALQNAIHSRRAPPLKYYLFDLLYLDGYSLIDAALQDRRKLLQQLIADADLPDTPTDGDMGWSRQAFPLLFSESILGDGPLVLRQACQLGVEGIVSKRLDSRYAAGRSDSWLKAKCLQRREFVVGGFTDSAASRTGFGALVLGLPANNGSLEYRGRVGTGFSEPTLKELGRLLRERRSTTCPFERSDLLLSKEKGTHWVEPTLLVEVEFGGWTGDGLLRFGSYRGVRDDLNLEEFRQESRNELGEVISQEASRATPAPGERPALDDGAASRLKLTHPERVVYAKPGITKLGIASYYAQVARFMLPHLAQRPLSLVRCPRGPAQRCFFQKHPPKGLPDAVVKHSVQLGGEQEWLLEASSGEALLALVQLNVLEFHIWGARFDRLDRPDRVVLDLDPDESVAWPRVVQAAQQIRELLETAGLTSFVKTTGGKGSARGGALATPALVGRSQGSGGVHRPPVDRPLAGQVHHLAKQSGSPRQDLPRLQSEYARSDQRGAVFHARPRGCRRVDAAHLGRTAWSRLPIGLHLAEHPTPIGVAPARPLVAHAAIEAGHHASGIEAFGRSVTPHRVVPNGEFTICGG